LNYPSEIRIFGLTSTVKLCPKFAASLLLSRCC